MLYCIIHHHHQRHYHSRKITWTMTATAMDIPRWVLVHSHVSHVVRKMSLPVNCYHHWISVDWWNFYIWHWTMPVRMRMMMNYSQYRPPPTRHLWIVPKPALPSELRRVWMLQMNYNPGMNDIWIKVDLWYDHKIKLSPQRNYNIYKHYVMPHRRNKKVSSPIYKMTNNWNHRRH